ncbi:MAG TPA: hypothetical protein VFZ78_01380 [Flavisolibacter sp.]
MIFCFSCSKEDSLHAEPRFAFRCNGALKKFTSSQVSATGRDWCGRRLYTISAQAGGEVFMMSIITDTLKTGTYILDEEGGVNLWTATSAAVSETPFVLQITRNHDQIQGTFSGQLSNAVTIEDGVINDLKILL